MSARYTVSENPFGYEADVGTHRLKFAVTDNKPDQTTVYMAVKRERVLMTGPEAAHFLGRPVAMPPFRHVCYTAVKEDADRLVEALNTVDDMFDRMNAQIAREAPHGIR